MDPEGKKPEVIPKKERPEIFDPLLRPSVSALRPLDVRFQRERRELSASPARKTITDHSKDSDPLSSTDRSDLTATMNRKTISLKNSPLSMKERRELVRSISIVVPDPEVPLWFNEELDDVAEGDDEEEEEEESEPRPREPVATQSRFAPQSSTGLQRVPSPTRMGAQNRLENSSSPTKMQGTPSRLQKAPSRLQRAPTKRIFPHPSEKDQEKLSPFSQKERRALVRSLSVAVAAAPAAPLWDMDVSESDESRPTNMPTAVPPPREEAQTKSQVSKPGKRHRKVRVHVTDLARSHAIDSFEFCGNKIKSSKYSLATFLPMNLFMQCCRAANLYFILIAAIQLIPGFSPTNWGTTMVPLSFVLLLNATKEAIDDFKRNMSDTSVNKQKVEVLKDGEFLVLNWGSVIVGDIVRVKCDHEFPADLVFLSSSDAKGLAYVETSNLDGEPSLKVRNAFYKGSQSTADEEDDSSPSIFSGLTIECELPNSRLYRFDGAINLQDYGKLPLDIRQILLRGATLRNTEWILGVVVYTGADTKFVRNMIPGQFKITELERNVNILVTMMFLCQVALCVGLAVGQDHWQRTNSMLTYVPVNIFETQVGVLPSEIGAQFGRFLVLLNQIIPISLYVTLEIVKVAQSYFLDRDIQMYHKPTNTYARARTTNLNEELGQVQYVMTDKTGTLTQNLMTFVQCSIHGVVYGSEGHVGVIQEGPTKDTIHTISKDPNLIDAIKRIAEGSKESVHAACHAFFSHLAICHVIQPVRSRTGKSVAPDGKPVAPAATNETITDELQGDITYTGASPDEEALVQGAADCGYQLNIRGTDELLIKMPGLGLQKFDILATLEFTSERRRMSIICRDSKGRIKLYCKGADTVLFKRLGKDQDKIIESTLQQLEDFARCGYRTLCMAERELSDAEYEQWADQFRAASVALDERDEKVATVAEAIERDMILLGVTAVEDKLQAGVPETITVLALAGIKVWVLTGDKLETSVSVALSCNLLADSMHLFLMSDAVQKSVPQMLRSMLDEARRQQHSKLRMEGSYHSDMAIVIEGNSLSVALEDNNKLVFLELCQLCRSVICCRVSPIQKAQVKYITPESFVNWFQLRPNCFHLKRLHSFSSDYNLN